MTQSPGNHSPSRNKSLQTFMFVCAENLNDLLVCHRSYGLSRGDILLFMHLSMEAASNSLSVKIRIPLLSVFLGLSEETVYSSVLKLRWADLIRQREHSFMINPAYFKFGKKQVQAIQRVNWAKLKPHSKAETHSIEVIKKLKKDIHL